MAARDVTGRVRAPDGHKGLDAQHINPASGLHKRVWTSSALDLSGSAAVEYGPMFPNNRCIIQLVNVIATEAVVTGQEAIIQLGIRGDADEFGTLDYETDATVADGQSLGETFDATSFLTENENALEAGEMMMLSLTGDSDGGTGEVVVHVEYIVLDDV